MVITGAPRSGTTYLANLLGWNHEEAYGIGSTDEILAGPADTPEVSWLAIPHLKGRQALVGHLIRHPQRCVASMIATGYFLPCNTLGQYLYRYTSTWDPWLQWMRWIEMCEEVSQFTIRLEDIQHLGPSRHANSSSHFIPIPDSLLLSIESFASHYHYTLLEGVLT